MEGIFLWEKSTKHIIKHLRNKSSPFFQSKLLNFSVTNGMEDGTDTVLISG